MPTKRRAPTRSELDRISYLIATRDWGELGRLCRQCRDDCLPSAPVCFGLALSHASRDDFYPAIDLLHEAISIDATHVDAHFVLARLLLRVGRTEAGERRLGDLVAAREASADLCIRAGALLDEFGRHRAAADAYRQAVTSAADPTEAYCRLAKSLLDAGDAAAAEATLEPLIRTHGASVPMAVSLGNVKRAIGKFDEAEVAFRQALEIDPECVPALANISKVKTFTKADPDFAALVSMAMRSGLAAGPAAEIQFALAKAKNDLGRPAPEVFKHYREGARLKATTFRYDVRTDEAKLDRIRAEFTQDYVDGRLPPAGGTGATLAFIVGMPRSGTTLLEQMLLGHSAVKSVGESEDLERLTEQAWLEAGKTFPDGLGTISTERLARIAEDYRARARERVGPSPVTVDKMPANFVHAGLLAVISPDTRVLHMRRDPLDTCVSCYTNSFSVAQGFSYDLEALGRYYRAYDTLVGHWASILPDTRFKTVEYETLVARPEETLTEILAFLDLDWEPACLDFHQSGRSVRTASVAQVRQPVYQASVGRWQRFGDEIGPLRRALGPLARG